MQQLPAALVAFTAYRQFIVYKVFPSQTRPGKTDKFPCDYRTGIWPVDAHTPSVWTDAQNAIAIAAALGQGYGVGFVFTEQDPFWFVDLDDAAEEDGSGWKSHAISICNHLAGAAIEVSISGKGLHIFGVGRPPSHSCESSFRIGGFYHTRRFVALTGENCSGNAGLDCSAALPALVNAYWPPTESEVKEWSDQPDPEWNGPRDDADLLRRAMQSRSTAAAFGNKASFADLWLANEQVLSQAYPDKFSNRPYDCSLADMALAQHLAFWTGNNCERIQRLMKMSKLVREKWDRDDYLPRTISGAVARQDEVLIDKPSPQPHQAPQAGLVPSGSPHPTVSEGESILSGSQQMDLFGSCVYVSDQHRALIPGGRLLKPDQFRVHFGGYSFQIDRGNEKMSRDPWEAWTQSQIFKCPQVDGVCFRPDLEPGIIIERGGQRFVNTYFPVNVARIKGDVSPFLDLLRRVLPDATDREILLSYMAACVQHKGIKFQWAPLLQGVEGNGKTLFTRCVAEATGRRYVHWPKASKLHKDFNAWMVGKIFFAVEDIYVPDAQRQIIEDLKPLITGGDGLEIEAKGVDQTSADICGNFMFNSNHKVGIPKTANDRRFCFLYTAQQQVSDLARDGMSGDYFPRLYDWLRADGYALVNELLHTYPIAAAYNPAGACQRAPKTTTTDEAIGASMGSVEQEIQEAISQGLPGFCGGWISSIWLDRLLERMGLLRRVTHSKRKEMLSQMGFSFHPAFVDGRVNNPVTPDGGKPRLYIHQTSMARQITDPAAAAKAYEVANNGRMVAALPFQARGNHVQSM